MRFVVLSKSHFSNELHFTFPQKLPEPPLELSESLFKFLIDMSRDLYLLTFRVSVLIGVSLVHARSCVA